MEFFNRAKIVRLRSYHGKFLVADDDEDNVLQDRNGTTRNARWAVELSENANHIRLKSRYGKYLTASNSPLLLGVKGLKVTQSLPKRLEGSVEWEPIREGNHVRFVTCKGQYLRANGGMPPWRNSITHDIPLRESRRDWLLWTIDVLEVQPTYTQKPELQPKPQPLQPTPVPIRTHAVSYSEPNSPTAFELASPSSSKSDDRVPNSSKKGKERTIYYCVVDDETSVGDSEELSFTFEGNGVEELKERLMDETGYNDITVCSRSPLNGKLFPLRLHLPPNNVDMHIVVVSSSSKVAAES